MSPNQTVQTTSFLTSSYCNHEEVLPNHLRSILYPISYCSANACGILPCCHQKPQRYFCEQCCSTTWRIDPASRSVPHILPSSHPAFLTKEQLHRNNQSPKHLIHGHLSLFHPSNHRPRRPRHQRNSPPPNPPPSLRPKHRQHHRRQKHDFNFQNSITTDGGSGVSPTQPSSWRCTPSLCRSSLCTTEEFFCGCFQNYKSPS